MNEESFHFCSTNLKCSCGRCFDDTVQLMAHINETYTPSDEQGDFFDEDRMQKYKEVFK